VSDNLKSQPSKLGPSSVDWAYASLTACRSAATDNRLVLIDLIARTLGAHRDDVIDDVARLTF
jgi:hypothetical protein